MSRAPNRFFGLHCHTGVGSPFDGLGYPPEHFQFALENGMDGMAITEHGNMNSFSHAYLAAEALHKKGHKFKYVPGCEMYLHPDLEEWKRDLAAAHEARDENKRLEKERKAAAKEAAKRARDEGIVTPIAVETDGDGEVIDVTNALTIENEDESKSQKFFNPVNRRHHLVVLPKTSHALEKLFNLVSLGYIDGFYRFPRIDYKMLKEMAEGDNFIVSTACIAGSLNFEVLSEMRHIAFDELHPRILDDPLIMDRVLRKIGNAVDRLADAVGRHNVNIEVQFNKLGAQHVCNRALIEFAKRNGFNLLATPDSHYFKPDVWKEREIYKRLGWLNYTEFDPNSLPKSVDDLKCELYPKNAQQMWDEYKRNKKDDFTFYDDQEMCDAIERAHDLAHTTIGDIHPDRSMKLPSYVVPEGKTAIKALMDECKKGMVELDLADKPEYIARLKHELSIIKELKEKKDRDFSIYFLTLKAILDVARENMLIGPGRGSGAGSLVCYVLRITDVDPLKYNLLFERFLNIHRAEPPDIDTDIADRDKLLELLREKFGTENVIPISNYNTFKLKTLTKDIARFYGVDYKEANEAVKTVDEDVKKQVLKHGMDKNLFVLTYEDALQHSPSFKAFLDKYPHVSEPMKVLFKQNKALGRHAGGVIVSERIKERMPLITSKGEAQTPWVEGLNYKHLEEFGWVKFDLLGLETLRIVMRAIELILQRREGIKHPIYADVKKWYEENMSPQVLDFDDPKVYDYVYCAGRWAGIFQLTESGAQRLFKKAKPRCLIDIATLTSVYRPGPLAAKVDELYIDAKNVKPYDWGHPLINQSLAPTYGCIIFQEQVMQLAHEIGGFPLDECDKVRKAIMKRSISGGDEAKKKAQELKEKFVKGAVGKGIPESIADNLYEKILYFAGYGFNKAHAVSYAMDSFYCAWLMTYYEEEWLCAYLESMSGNPDSRAKAFGEVKALGYSIVPIDINYATSGWTILEGKRFMPSMSSCKGVGDTALEEIEEMRPFESVEQMLWNEDGTWRPSKFNKKALESLIKVRAFDSMDIVGEGKLFGSYRQMYEVLIENAIEIKKSGKTDPFRGQKAFRELVENTRGLQEWTKQELVGFSQELLGALDVGILVPPALQDKLAAKGVRPVDQWDEKGIYWALVAEAVPKKTKNGKHYLLLKVMGMNGKLVKCFCWGAKEGQDIPPNTPILAEFDNGDFGLSTQMWRVKELST